MKSLHRSLSVLAATALLCVPIVAAAADFRTADRAVLEKSETIAGNFYAAGGTVSSAGEVRGDLFAAGGTLLVSGPVDSDAALIGGNLTVLSDTKGDLRAAGGNILVNGSVGGDVLAAGGQIDIMGAKVGGDVAIAGGTVRIDAPVTGNMKIAGGTIYINSPVTGNVEIKADKLTLGPKAAIAGNLTYTASSPATLETGAQVKGETVFTKRAARPGASGAQIVGLISLALFLKLLMQFVAALLIGYLLRRYAQTMTAAAYERPLLEIGRGIITLIVLPVVSVALLLTVIGIPFGVLGVLAFAALCLFTALTAPIVTGAIVHKWIWKPEGFVIDWKTILLGTLIYFALMLIPIVGWVVRFGIFLLVFGASLGIKWSALKEWR